MAGLQGEKVWKAAAAALAVVAVGATVCTYQRTQDSQRLRQQLTAATADAKQAHDRASTLEARLDASQKRVSDEQEQLTSAKEQATAEAVQLQAASRPDLPIKLSFRRALLTQGQVAVMQNLSSRTLEIVLEVQSAATGAHFRRALVINPGQVGQFGPQEGWPFASGQIVTLSNPSFRSITATVGG